MPVPHSGSFPVQSRGTHKLSHPKGLVKMNGVGFITAAYIRRQRRDRESRDRLEAVRNSGLQQVYKRG